MLRQSMTQLTRGWTRAATLACAAGTAAFCVPASDGSECPALEYRAVDGANRTWYEGDLDAGVFHLVSTNERAFTVHREGDPQGPQTGAYHANGALYNVSVYLTGYIPSGDPMGYGDVVLFEGGGSGTDFLAVDENGRTIEGEFLTLALIDRRDLDPPRIYGTGAVQAVTHSDDAFQSVALNFLRTTGSVQTEAVGNPDVSLKFYIESNGAGGMEIDLLVADLVIDGNWLPADLDDDGVVGLSDLGLLLAAYGACIGDDGYLPDADLNHNGCIDLPDLGELLSVYDQGCY